MTDESRDESKLAPGSAQARAPFRANEIGAKGQQSNESNVLGLLRSATH